MQVTRPRMGHQQFVKDQFQGGRNLGGGGIPATDLIIKTKNSQNEIKF